MQAPQHTQHTHIHIIHNTTQHTHTYIHTYSTHTTHTQHTHITQHPPQHGLSSDTMTLITSERWHNELSEHQMALIASGCARPCRAGVGKLRLIDFDNVSLSSLNRHACATRRDVGHPKVNRAESQLTPTPNLLARRSPCSKYRLSAIMMALIISCAGRGVQEVLRVVPAGAAPDRRGRQPDVHPRRGRRALGALVAFDHSPPSHNIARIAMWLGWRGAASAP